MYKLIPLGMLCNSNQRFPAKRKGKKKIKRRNVYVENKEVLILSCESGYLLTSLQLLGR